MRLNAINVFLIQVCWKGEIDFELKTELVDSFSYINATRMRIKPNAICKLSPSLGKKIAKEMIESEK